jgi:hypothetical protein
MEESFELESFLRHRREEISRRSNSVTSPAAVAVARPSAKKKKPITTFSMYQSLHDEVSNLLAAANLHFEFWEDDDETKCTRVRDTNIMGRFVCHNRACRSKGWPSNMIATRIRLYPGHKYNARVYHQRCKVCSWVSRPMLDQSYAERIVYWIKRWSGVRVDRPPISHESRGPHNHQLCEGCKAGHCSQSGDDWVTRLDRFDHPSQYKELAY